MRLTLAILAALATTASASPDPKQPSEIVVVLDRSTTMKGERFDLARAAIVDMVETLRRDDRVAIVAYGKRATVVSALAAPDRARVAKVLASLSAGGDDAELATALDAVGKLFARDARQVDRHVVVVTAHGRVGRANPLDRRDITVSTIAVQSDDHAALDELARASNGQAFAATDLIDLQTQLVAAAHPPWPHRPRQLVIVLDASLGMRGARLDAAKEAARIVVETLASEDVVSLVVCDTRPNIVLPPRPAANRIRTSTEIQRIVRGGPATYGPSLAVARDLLNPNVQTGNHILFLTDGKGDDDGLVDQLVKLRKSRVAFTAVELDHHDHDALQAIVDRAGGTLFTLDQLPQLVKTFGDAP